MSLLSALAVFLFASPVLAQTTGDASGESLAQYDTASTVARRIKQNLRLDGTVPADAWARVEFEYDAEGALVNFKFIRHSGFVSYDRAIERALFMSEPFRLKPSVRPDGTLIRKVELTLRAAALALPAEAATYEAAMERFKGGDYLGAETMLVRFIGEQPQAPTFLNAQYWLGNAYFLQRKYAAAAERYRLLMEKYPQGNRTPDAILSLASIYTMQGQGSVAEETLLYLIDRYPGTEPARLAAERLADLDKQKK